MKNKSSPHPLLADFPLECWSSGPTQPKQVVLMLHGFGARGDDLISVASQVSLPDTLWVCAQAPYQTPFGGFQWFGLFEKPEPSRSRALEQLALCYDHIRTNICPRIALLGFSQGAAVALHLGLKTLQEHPPTHVVSMSGFMMAITVNSLAELPERQRQIPIFLSHGLQDNIVLPSFYFDAVEVLKAQHFAQIHTHTSPKTAHGIDEAMCAKVKNFLQSHAT